MEEYNLVDIWRSQNLGVPRFTFHRGPSDSRIDFWLMQEHLSNLVVSSDISPSIFSDHSIPSLVLRLGPSFPRGPGLWKFNGSLLQDTLFVNHMREKLKDLKQDSLQDDPIQRWQFIKFQIRSTSIEYSKNKKSKQRRLERDLESELCSLESLEDLGIEVAV